MADIHSFSESLKLLANGRRAADDDEPVLDHILGLQRLQFDGEIAELQEVLSAGKNIHKAPIVNVTRRSDVFLRMMQELVVEIFDVLFVLFLSLAVGLRYAYAEGT